MDAQLKRILVGVDDSEDALMAFDYAINLALKDNAELVIVSVLENDEMNVFKPWIKIMSTVNAMRLKNTS